MATVLDFEIVGKSQRATGIHLYPGNQVAEWRAALATAQQQFGGVSLGVGLLGSPGWVLAGAAAMGAIESVLSSKSAKEGVQTLALANRLLESLRLSGETYLFDDVSGLDNPSPSLWRAEGESHTNIDMSKVPMLDVGRLLKTHNKARSDIIAGKLRVRSSMPFIGLDEDFIRLRLDNGRITNIRWSMVDTFRFAEA